MFRAALLAATELEVVGATGTDDGGVRAAAAHRPDLILVVAARPDVEGAKFVGRVRAVAPGTAVVAVAAPEDRPRSLVARGLTADRYVDPDVATVDLLGMVVTLLDDRRAEAPETHTA
jgi:DNA-binding NarL/FixJ family response regulator